MGDIRRRRRGWGAGNVDQASTRALPPHPFGDQQVPTSRRSMSRPRVEGTGPWKLLLDKSRTRSFEQPPMARGSLPFILFPDRSSHVRLLRCDTCAGIAPESSFPDACAYGQPKEHRERVCQQFWAMQ